MEDAVLDAEAAITVDTPSEKMVPVVISAVLSISVLEDEVGSTGDERG
jgi:hypothetical protein